MSIFYQDEYVTIIHGDCRVMLDMYDFGIVHTCVTSPPYFNLRDYKGEDQIGRESTPDMYIGQICGAMDQVRTILYEQGTCWLNIADVYAHRAYEHVKQSDLVGIPWTIALRMREKGWYLRRDIIWSKPAPMPENVQTRPTTAHEYIFLLAKSRTYYYDFEAIQEDAITAGQTIKLGENSFARRQQKGAGKLPTGNGTANEYKVKDKRNKRSVWTVAHSPFKGAHFAVFPPDLIEPCILAGAPVGGTVIDPFAGAGTTGVVAKHHGRMAILIEQNRNNCQMAADRIANTKVHLPTTAAETEIAPAK